MSDWSGTRVLVTGDSGFKGTWLTLWLQQLGASVVGISLPQPDDRAISRVVDSEHEHHDVEIRDAEAVRRAVQDAEPDFVFHLAAQALVRRAYDDPLLTYETNVMGTANVLEAVGKTSSVTAALFITSDKVYRQDGGDHRFKETDRLGGNDPYSASKACAELVVAEGKRRHPDVAISTVRAGNVVGGGDRAPDRLLPDVVRSIEAGVPVSIRNPGATRPWEHVMDAVSGYLATAAALRNGDDVPHAINFGPASSATVEVVLDQFLGHLGRGSWELSGDEHPHEDPLLSLDITLAGDSLGWRPSLDLATTLAWTAEWYRTQLEGGDLTALTRDQIERFGSR